MLIIDLWEVNISENFKCHFVKPVNDIQNMIFDSLVSGQIFWIANIDDGNKVF